LDKSFFQIKETMKAMDLSRSSERFHLLVIFACFLTRLTAAPAEHSQLWGAAGEKWDARGRLPDFSFAGYQRGEKPLPKQPTGRSVKEFGAKGDGEKDDSAAFLAAIEAVTQHSKLKTHNSADHSRESRLSNMQRSSPAQNLSLP
jgi:hypothetical protein